MDRENTATITMWIALIGLLVMVCVNSNTLNSRIDTTNKLLLAFQTTYEIRLYRRIGSVMKRIDHYDERVRRNEAALGTYPSTDYENVYEAGTDEAVVEWNDLRRETQRALSKNSRKDPGNHGIKIRKEAPPTSASSVRCTAIRTVGRR